METAHLPNGTLLQGGRYKIVRFIGSGGFGCTYEGEHTMLQRRVAIKEFFVRDFCNRDETTSHVSVGITEKKGLVKKLGKKFVEEARFTARMRHPNIARVSDVFEENGTAYYVMDYMYGPSLDELVKKSGPLKEGTALKYIRQVADALAYVHKQNRLHLDVKPGNIMTDERENAVLIDFGASKQYDEVGGENTSTLMGKTPGYAPIEQMGNTVTTFTPATDIYALGATLYKLLTGVTPLEATMLASGEELAPLPSNISASTANAVSSAMQLAKSKRPQTIAEFLSLLKFEEKGATEEPHEKTERKSRADETVLDTTSSLKRGEPNADLSDKTDNEATELNSTKKTKGFLNGHEYVDLGLSVKWATCNVGASSPEEFGDYYAWGETETKDKYEKQNCLTYKNELCGMVGDPKYDVARAKWGATWRMPTEKEIDELISQCKVEWTKKGNGTGYKIIGLNGNSIFLPAAGCCYKMSGYTLLTDGFYWSSTQDFGDTRYAFCLHFRNSLKKGLYDRSFGRSVRPVTE